MQESLAGSEGLSYICNHYMGLHWSTSHQCCFLNHPLFNDVTPLVDMSAATLAVGGNNDERLTDVDKVVPTLVSFSSLLPPEFILCSTVSLYSAPSSLCSYLTPLQPQDHAHIVTLFYSHYIILLTLHYFTHCCSWIPECHRQNQDSKPTLHIYLPCSSFGNYLYYL